tara:strand:- start:698 stop:1612 length:915 start_codon:yes stop_codon:yes gene_type:complete
MNFLNLKNKINYLKISLKKFILNKGYVCPSCNSKHLSTIERKYLISSLKRCKNCELLFRAPTTTHEENKIFYQEDYSEGFTTDCPNNEELEILKNNNFISTDKDYTRYIEILKKIKNEYNHNNLKLFDYGCSWGYGSYQLQKEFNVTSYEVSLPRARYAIEKLNINVLNQKELEKLENTENVFDIFFMSHVLEHLPNPKKTLEFAMKVLKKDGYLISFTPNGSFAHKKLAKNWSQLWGNVHPNFIDEKFYSKHFENNKYYIGSTSRLKKKPFFYDQPTIENFLKAPSQLIDDISGAELLIMAKK